MSFTQTGREPPVPWRGFVGTIAIWGRHTAWVCAAFCLFASLQTSRALAQGVHLRQLDTQQGLSNNTVNALVQDDQGFMWIGTADGLNRHDGYSFKIFKPRHGIAGGISDNDISALHASQEALWVGCGDGLEKYSFENGIFERIQELDGSHVFAIQEAEDGLIWVATSRGIGSIDPRSRALKYQAQPLATAKACLALSANSGFLWIGTDSELLRWSPHQSIMESHLAMDKVQAILDDGEGNHWLATLSGVSLISNQNISAPQILKTWSEPQFQGATCFAKDLDGTIWLGTPTGLFHYQSSGEWQPVTLHRDGVQFNIAAVRSLFVDRSGLLWIGTQRMGLFLRDPNTDYVRHYSLPLETNLRAFVEDPQGAVWLASSHDLYKIHTDQPFDQPSHIMRSANELTSLSLGPANRLFLGTKNRGVLDYTIGSGKTETLTGTSGLGRIRQLAFANGSLWFSTGDALHRYALETTRLNSWHPSFDYKEILSLFLSENGDLYLGGQGQLMAYAPGTNSFNTWKVRERSSQVPPRLQVIYQFKPDEVWIGTNQGLLLFDRRRGGFRGWSTADGLPNDDVRGLASDAHGQLWVATQRGLARLTPGSTAFKSLTTRSGALTNEFLLGSALQTSDNHLLFGGQDGFNILSPNLRRNTTYQPELVLTQLQIQNNPVFPGPGSPLTQSIETTKFLKLQYGHYMISFQFAALDFAQPEENRYAYKLVGHDQEWRYVGADSRTANFTHLEPGAYTLRVKGTNHDGIWSTEEASAFIIVRPPWWRTTWAYVAYGLLALAIISIWPLLHLRNIKKRRVQLELIIASRNRDLETKNHELRNMNHILRAINETTNRDSLMQVLLEKGAQLVPRAEKLRFLFLDDKHHCYSYCASTGYRDQDLQDIHVDLEQAIDHYAPEYLRMASGIHHIVAPHTHPIGPHPAPACTLSMTLKVGSTLAGFLLFDNFTDTRAFDQSDVERLLRLREHAVTATARIMLMEELQQTTQNLTETRSQLLEAAHLAGRTDTITSLLHNIGNALNSLKVSATVMQREMTGEEALQMFGRMVGLLEENNQDLASFLTSDPRGKRMPQALRDLQSLLVENRLRLVQEMESFTATVETICNIINAEQRYANGNYLDEDVSLLELFDNVLRMFGDSLSRDKIRVTYRQLDPFQVRVQRAKFVQVVGNLLQNAREAMVQLPPEADRVLTVSARKLKQEVEITLCDTGPGIDPAIITKIFQQGFTTKVNGTGYGLHYCANAMTEMRGTIKASNNPNGGACFTLTVPLSKG